MYAGGGKTNINERSIFLRAAFGTPGLHRLQLQISLHSDIENALGCWGNHARTKKGLGFGTREWAGRDGGIVLVWRMTMNASIAEIYLD